MNIIEKKVAELKPFEKNARIHPPSQIELLIKNIKRFGFTVPVLIDKNDVIIAGHGRIIALKQMGVEDVPCVLMDKLTEEEVAAPTVRRQSTGNSV